MNFVTVTPLVRLPRGVEQLFTYQTENVVSVGQVVTVKFRRRLVLAVVRQIDLPKPTFNTLPVAKILPFRLTPTQELLSQMLVNYYGVPESLAYATIIPDLERKAILDDTHVKTNWQHDNLRDSILTTRQHILLSGNYPNPVAPAIKDYIDKMSKVGQVLLLVPDHFSLNELATHYPTAVKWNTSSTKDASEAWRKVYTGGRLVIGTRAALFAPFINLKSIVIIDSTSELYQSRDATPHYNVVRLSHTLSRQIHCKVLLQQSIPTLAEGSGYTIAIHQKPDSLIELIDRQAYSPADKRMPVANALLKSIANTKGRVLVLVHRKGYSTLHCAECEYIPRCHQCDTPLTSLTRNSSELHCNRCTEKTLSPDVCPDCGSRTLIHMGFGIKRYLEYLSQNFPKRPLIEISGELQNSSSDNLKSIKTVPANAIIVSTVAVVPRLWLLPQIDMSIITRADDYTIQPSWKVIEDFYVFVSSIKYKTTGTTYIEVSDINNKIMQLINQKDFRNFWAKERTYRRQRLLPPFGHMYVITSKTGWDYKKLPDEFKLVTSSNSDYGFKCVLVANNDANLSSLWQLLSNDAKVDVDPHSPV